MTALFTVYATIIALVGATLLTFYVIDEVLKND